MVAMTICMIATPAHKFIEEIQKRQEATIPLLMPHVPDAEQPEALPDIKLPPHEECFVPGCKRPRVQRCSRGGQRSKLNDGLLLCCSECTGDSKKMYQAYNAKESWLREAGRG